MSALRTRGFVGAALAALVLAAGCGDSNDTTLVLGDTTPTPASPGRTATPTPHATATVGATTPVPTPTPGGAVNPDVQTVVSDLLPFLTTGPTLLSGGSVSALTAGAAGTATLRSAEALKNDPCPDGGTRVDDEGVPVRTITLDACDVSDPQLGAFEFDGTITITLGFSGATIAFDFTATDLARDHTVHFEGTLTGALQNGGFVLDGPVTIMTPEGDFTLQLHAITIDSTHHLVSGSGTVSDDDDNFDVDTIAMTITEGGQSASFTVTFDDSSVHTYLLDLETGQLTQTS